MRGAPVPGSAPVTSAASPPRRSISAFRTSPGLGPRRRSLDKRNSDGVRVNRGLHPHLGPVPACLSRPLQFPQSRPVRAENEPHGTQPLNLLQLCLPGSAVTESQMGP